MAPNDLINLCKNQWIDVRAGTDGRRLIVDHPLNALLVGVPGPATVVRSPEFVLEPGDSMVSIYVTRAGIAHRAATAVVRERKSGALFLADWRLEPGFGLQSEGSSGHRTHRIVPSRIDGAASILAEVARGQSADGRRKTSALDSRSSDHPREARQSAFQETSRTRGDASWQIPEGSVPDR